MTQLMNIITIRASLRLITGLRIGAGDAAMHIGGIDNPVVKHPLTGVPYIPGSSLKGKMRSLLEWRSGAVQEKPLGAREYEKETDIAKKAAIKNIVQLFGMGGGEMQDNKKLVLEIGPTRLAFWDCHLEEAWKQEVRENNQLLTEVKSENIINRISGTAEHPRNTERIPAGARFDFCLSLKKLAGDDELLLTTVLEGLKLIELDSLGGSGSRGYGKVRFENLHINDTDASQRFKAVQAFPHLQQS